MRATALLCSLSLFLLLFRSLPPLVLPLLPFFSYLHSFFCCILFVVVSPLIVCPSQPSLVPACIRPKRLFNIQSRILGVPAYLNQTSTIPSLLFSRPSFAV